MTRKEITGGRFLATLVPWGLASACGRLKLNCTARWAQGDRKFSKIRASATRPGDNLCNLISNKMLMNHLMLEGILVRRGALAPHGWLVSGSFVFVSDLAKFRGFNTRAANYGLGSFLARNRTC